MGWMNNNGEQKINRSLTLDVVVLLAVASCVLLIPLVAMQLTTEVVWTLSDFVAAAILIIGTGMVYLIAARMVKTRRQRAVLAVLIGLAFLTIWAKLAVGIFH